MNFRTFAIALVACGIASARVIEKRQGTPGASYQSYTGTGNEGGGGCRGARVQLGSHLRGQETTCYQSSNSACISLVDRTNGGTCEVRLYTNNDCNGDEDFAIGLAEVGDWVNYTFGSFIVECF
ncbi:hypothetical protein GT037_005473 [Alternaria burnsii]|uniref:Uncharacterized protein n=1 Tax=Alternaria burnsii TaxID=1187904 RepID=A0A8H7EFK9_9PLEO|nr:uncharacterized protein GT037_005473 [Alternaria burnsii]KAF7675968.1 hypothetical protein GT037_005473 [Alternaria burnsii]CAI9627897.1 unnamed protein product [Alternaria burnsii]